MGFGSPGRAARLAGTAGALLLAASCAGPGAPPPEGDVAGAAAPDRETADLRFLQEEARRRAFWPDFGREGRVPDAVAATPELLLAHVRLGRAARAELPWAADLDEETFRRYVLAYRMTTERLADWRTYFWTHAELRPLVEGFAARYRGAASDAERSRVFRGMIHELNTGWVGRRVPYAPRGMPDLNPLEAIARGTGRCTDETNTLIAILRTFGIAATGVRVVWWPEAADNHTWTAVYDPAAGEWLDVDSGQAGSADDPAYFHRFVRNPGRKVAKVVWVAPGAAGDASCAPPALRDGEAYPPGIEKYLVAKPVEDRTGRYAEVADLVRDGVPPDALVWLSVWNSGLWRPVAGARATASGAVTFPGVGCGVRYRLMTWAEDGPAFCRPEVLVCRTDGSVESSPPDPRDEAALLELAALHRLESGDPRGAKEALVRALAIRPDAPDTLYNLACACARLGEKDEALDRLEQAVRAGWKNLAHMKVDPDLESLREEERFRRLVGAK